MKKLKIILIPVLAVALALAVCAGCSGSKEFIYSSGIDNNGFWKGIKALDYVELCEYTGISIPEDVYEITDESVQTEVDNILYNYATEKQITDRSIADGDTVNIDYTGSIDGVEFEGGSTDGFGAEVTIGTTEYIDDFLEQLIGHTPGESFNIEVTFPENYGNEELDGKDAVFAITVNYIVEMITPELTDDFVSENLSSYYSWNTVAEMEEDIMSNLQSSAMLYDVPYYLQEYIVENTTITSLPESLLEYQEKSLIYYYEDYADYYEMDLDEFLSTYAGVSNTDELLEANLDDNTETARFYLIFQAIAEDAGITVTDDDVAAYFIEYVGVEDYSEYEESYGMPYLKLTVLHQSVMDYIIDKAIME